MGINMKKKSSKKFGSLLVSLIFGATLGWYISTLVSKLIVFPNMEWIFVLGSLLLVGFFGYKNPKTTELFAFLFSAWIFLQVLWDLGAEPVFGIWRTTMTLIAIGNFFLNGFTGYLGFKPGWRALKRALGGR